MPILWDSKTRERSRRRVTNTLFRWIRSCRFCKATPWACKSSGNCTSTEGRSLQAEGLRRRLPQMTSPNSPRESVKNYCGVFVTLCRCRQCSHESIYRAQLQDAIRLHHADVELAHAATGGARDQGPRFAAESAGLSERARLH